MVILKKGDHILLQNKPSVRTITAGTPMTYWTLQCSPGVRRIATVPGIAITELYTTDTGGAVESRLLVWIAAPVVIQLKALNGEKVHLDERTSAMRKLSRFSSCTCVTPCFPDVACVMPGTEQRKRAN